MRATLTGPVEGAELQDTSLTFTFDGLEGRTDGRMEVMTGALHRFEDAHPIRTPLNEPVTVKEENTLMLYFFFMHTRF